LQDYDLLNNVDRVLNNVFGLLGMAGPKYAALTAPEKKVIPIKIVKLFGTRFHF